MAECAAFYQCFQVFVGGADDAHIHRCFFGITDTADGLFLNGAQEFDLHGQRQIGDFIEEQRAAVGMLEKAETVLICTGKAAFFVTEKFAFHQVFGNCAAVHRDKRADSTRRQFVYAAGGLLFTRTGFAGNVNRHVASGQAAD